MKIKQLHEELRNYGHLDDRDKPVVIAGLSVAIHYGMQEYEFDNYERDGEAVYGYLEENVDDDVFLNVMGIIKSDEILNSVNEHLSMTPLHYFFNCVKEIAEEYGYDKMGQYYMELMRFTNGNAQNLGIVLTPQDMVNLCVRISGAGKEDVVLDPCAGTGAFLIAAHTNAIGIETRPYIYALAKANVILYKMEERITLKCGDMFQTKEKGTIGLVNPPYSQGTETNKNLYEANFLKHLMEMLKPEGKMVAIVPKGTFTNNIRNKAEVRDELLDNNTLEGVITLNYNRFSECSVAPCICVFTAGIPHKAEHECVFVDVPGNENIDIIYDLWTGKITDERRIVHTVGKSDEWMHGYFKESMVPPEEEKIKETVKDYMRFRFNAGIDGRTDLLFPLQRIKKVTKDIHWERKKVEELFEIGKVSRTKQTVPGKIPVISAMTKNNGQLKYVEKATEKGGVLAVESAVAGYTTYQHVDFTVNDHITKLIPKFDMHPYVALYFCALLNYEHKGKFNYGYKPTKKRLPKEEIYVPVTKDHKPALGYMKYMVSEFIWEILKIFEPDAKEKYDY